DDDVFWRSDNTSFDVEYWTVPLIISGEHQGSVVSFMNISERRKQQSESIIKSAAIETSHGGIVMADLNGVIFYVNKSIVSMWRYDSIDELINRPVTDFWLSTEKAQSTINNIMNEGSCSTEMDARRKDGSVFTTHLSANITPDKEGYPLCLMASFIDITDQKETQAALKRSEETYAKAEAIAHIGSWDWDILTGDLRWTDEIYRIFGQRPQAFGATYEAFLDTIHPDDRDNVTNAVNATVSEPDTPYSIEHRVIRPDGEIRTVQENGKVYRNNTNEPIRMIGTVHDITERKKIEIELEAHHEHLEELVNERTKELNAAQDELVKKERLATLGQLTATVSHELRNPLGAMRPSMYVLKKKIDQSDEKLMNAIERVERNIKRCDHIVDELLDFTRITVLDEKSINLDNWLDGIIKEQNIPKNITVQTNYQLNNIVVHYDSERLRRCVINVIDNACQAMQDEALVSSVDLNLQVSTRKKNNRIEIIVQDNGPGIDKTTLHRIFEPLFSTKGFGVGLGLPTVKQILQQHQGDIEVISDQDNGTKMIMWLPTSRIIEHT
ncbi:MAG: PAS domain-containing protein, partial [Gammaproteobacteria bacterium]|nr:PAS domain-containing protein [Gammaproteobacteria bacterium]